MHEVQPRAIAPAAQPRLHPLRREFRLQGLQAREREDRVVKVGPPLAIPPAALLRDLPLEKCAHQSRRIAQQSRGEPGDLEHFETQAALGKGGVHAEWREGLAAGGAAVKRARDPVRRSRRRPSNRDDSRRSFRHAARL